MGYQSRLECAINQGGWSHCKAQCTIGAGYLPANQQNAGGVVERPLFLPVLSAITGLTSAGVLGWSLPASMLLPLLVLGFLAIFNEHRFSYLLAFALLCFCWGNLALQPYLAPQLPANHIARFVADEPLQVEG